MSEARAEGVLGELGRSCVQTRHSGVYETTPTGSTKASTFLSHPAVGDYVARLAGETPVQVLGTELKARREQERLSQAALATAAGVSRKTVVRYETKLDHNPNLRKLSALARALHCTVDELGLPLEPAPGSANRER
jgi:DNA-binding XRE family transcriptional regulator